MWITSSSLSLPAPLGTTLSALSCTADVRVALYASLPSSCSHIGAAQPQSGWQQLPPRLSACAVKIGGVGRGKVCSNSGHLQREQTKVQQNMHNHTMPCKGKKGCADFVGCPFAVIRSMIISIMVEDQTARHTCTTPQYALTCTHKHTYQHKHTNIHTLLRSVKKCQKRKQ